MREVNEITCGCDEHVAVNTHVNGFKIKIISKVIRTPSAISVMMFQMNAHVDAPIVGVQQTEISIEIILMTFVKIDYL